MRDIFDKTDRIRQKERLPSRNRYLPDGSIKCRKEHVLLEHPFIIKLL